MLNRTAVLCLACVALVGYLLAGPSVRAQNIPTGTIPISVSVGDETQIFLARGTLQGSTVESRVNCRVIAIEGSWLKCASGDSLGSDRGPKWVNLGYAVQVTKWEK